MSGDHNLHNYYDTNNNTIEQLKTIGFPVVAPWWSDTLKITSGCRDFTALVQEIWGGQEDCVDVNNKASIITVHCDAWRPQGKYLATIKGGSRSVALHGNVMSHGTEVDVDIGNWSDQSALPTTETVLGLYSKTGKPIMVRVLNGTAPYMIDGTGPYVYAFPKPNSWHHKYVVWVFLTSLRIWKKMSL
jgi:hypothetical protein